jgi:hypothetical protein
MDDLERRLRAWFKGQADRDPPERLHRFVRNLPRDHPRGRERRRSKVLFASGPFRIGAVIGIAAAVVGVLLLLRLDRPPPGPLGSAPMSSAEQTFASPSTAGAGAGSLVWQKGAGIPNDPEVTALVAGRDGFLAATLAQHGERFAPEVWRSSDGLTWSKLAGVDAFPPADKEHDNQILALLRTPNGYLAVGASALLDSSTGDAKSWISIDGVHWQASPVQASLRDAEMNGVTTAGGSGLLAVGSDGFPGASTQLSGSKGAMVWNSHDGLAWSRVVANVELAGGLMRSLVDTQWGLFAYGTDLPLRTGASAPPLWRSSDGQRWERVSRLTFEGSYRQVIGVAATDGSLVAAGTAINAEPSTWVSTDSLDWQASAIELGSQGRTSPTQLAGIVPFRGELLMSGTMTVGGTDPFLETPIWSYEDLGGWKLVAEPAILGAGATRLAATSDRVVLAVRSPDPSGKDRFVFFVGTPGP